jgi:uncharacterized SAM-dependent methyltransferase
MEKEILLKYYDECKTFVTKFIDTIESCDTTILNKIQILTQNKKSFILESHIESFWNDFKRDVDILKIRERVSEMNNQRNQEAKMFEAFICYLLEIYLDEFKIDEYNLNGMYKQHYKKIESYLKSLRKSHGLDQTIEMNYSLVFNNYIFF